MSMVIIVLIINSTNKHLIPAFVYLKGDTNVIFITKARWAERGVDDTNTAG
jgi:hypothetical protein